MPRGTQGRTCRLSRIPTSDKKRRASARGARTSGRAGAHRPPVPAFAEKRLGQAGFAEDASGARCGTNQTTMDGSSRIERSPLGWSRHVRAQRGEVSDVFAATASRGPSSRNARKSLVRSDATSEALSLPVRPEASAFRSRGPRRGTLSRSVQRAAAASVSSLVRPSPAGTSPANQRERSTVPRAVGE